MKRVRKPAAIVVAFGVIALAGCGSDESTSEVTHANPTAESNGKPRSAKGGKPGGSKKPRHEESAEEAARTYALKVSGGKWENGGLSAAAYSACLEGLVGRHIGPAGVTYKDEFPEPELQAVYKKGLEDCGA